MSEKLLSIKEVCKYLNISEGNLRELVNSGDIPAYRLGGTILRFRKSQIDDIKSKGIPKVVKSEPEDSSVAEASRGDRLKDFFYFNDFYIISAIVIIILLSVILFY